MTNGQIAKLQDLSKCSMTSRDARCAMGWFEYAGKGKDYCLSSNRLKADLRRLTHQYRHQIAAIRKNRKS